MTIDDACAADMDDAAPAEDATLPMRIRVVEALAVAGTVACVWLLSVGSVWGMPTGIVSALLYARVFLHARLYSDVLLQIFFVATHAWGWWVWSDRAEEELYRTLSWDVRIGCVAAAAAGVVLLGGFMDRRTDAALPYWDAYTTSTSIVAQILLMLAFAEAWILWILVDIAAVGVYRKRKLHASAALYAVLLVLATQGAVHAFGKLSP